MLLDTGASFTMLSQPVLERWATTHPDWPRAIGAVGAANMGLGRVEAELAMLRLPEVTVGPFVVPNVGVVARREGVFEDWLSQSMSGPVVGALGGNFLRLCRIEIAYDQGAVYLEQHDQPGYSDMDVVGLVLTPQSDGGYLVDGTTGTSTLREAVRVGDRLVTVDGVEIRGQTLGAVIDRLRGKPGEMRVLLLDRDGARIEVSAAVERLL